MGISRQTRYLTAWIACFAMLLASLAPSISQSLAAGDDSGSIRAASWIEESPMHGEAHNASEQQAAHQHDHGNPSHHQNGSHFEHCPFCLTHAGSFALLQTVALTLHEVGGFSDFPSIYFQAPRLLFVWVTAQARAPPA